MQRRLYTRVWIHLNDILMSTLTRNVLQNTAYCNSSIVHWLTICAHNCFKQALGLWSGCVCTFNQPYMLYAIWLIFCHQQTHVWPVWSVSSRLPACVWCFLSVLSNQRRMCTLGASNVYSRRHLHTLAGVPHTVKEAGTYRHLVCLLQSRQCAQPMGLWSTCRPRVWYAFISVDACVIQNNVQPYVCYMFKV